MSRPVEKTVDGVKISTTKHATMRLLQLRGRLMKIVLPAIGGFAAAGKKLAAAGVTTANVGALLEQDTDELAPALKAFAEAIDPDALPALVCEILANTSVTLPLGENRTLSRIELHSSPNIDIAFDDQDELLFYKVLAHALTVNVGGFFAALARAGAKAEAEKTPSP